ncbi:DUF1963 domain-containing protein [Parvibium lacunae]|uniref:DUF1963 domain-containing protein n=1 Tax=Parvibium lacunae TaxID=1888893 RepID=A0A368L749_9BURK|nr:DUF1963 domain-containing protein [Parvibium lacunae]RCS59473.1 DUF1963 domain-containing protein [Parvibium lacunae]
MNRLRYSHCLNFSTANYPSIENRQYLSTQFGGQPTWINQPCWPLSAKTNAPMTFIGQIVIPSELFTQADGQCAYLFIADSDGSLPTWEPESGENAVIIQSPHALFSPPTFLTLSSLATGPTVLTKAHGAETDRVELFIPTFDLQMEPQFHTQAQRAILDDESAKAYDHAMWGNKIGGQPWFIQGDEYPIGDTWQLLAQLDECALPFYVNFGTGYAYIFINETLNEGRLLWQC